MERSRIRHARTPARRPHLERGAARPSAFVVGAGRLGSALARALSDEGWQVEAWARTPGRRLQGVPLHTGAFPAAIRGARLVLLTVPDRAIGEVARLLAAGGLIGRGQIVAHCSGATPLAPLEPARAAGASVGSMHPLVAATLAGCELEGCAAAVDGDPAAVRLLRQAARGVGLSPFSVHDDARARYHAAASLAANGLVSLVDLAAELLIESGAEPRAALGALLPLLRSSLRNLEELGLPDALTGPVARGDAQVVATHLRELKGHPALPAYKALQARALELARAQGAADPEGLERIARLLRRGR